MNTSPPLFLTLYTPLSHRSQIGVFGEQNRREYAVTSKVPSVRNLLSFRYVIALVCSSLRAYHSSIYVIPLSCSGLPRCFFRSGIQAWGDLYPTGFFE